MSNETKIPLTDLGQLDSPSKERPNQDENRETWKNSTETFLSALGAVIGLGNIWRFPYITYKYGGGAFLIPYIIFVIFCGFPMFFLETSLGQFTRRGAFQAWNIAPIMKGVGLGAAVLSFFSSLYYITVMAWSVLYFVQSIRLTDLPWMSCDNWYNTERCITYENATTRNLTDFKKIGNFSLPILEFWDNYVLRVSDDPFQLGGLDNWPMVLCMLASWVMIYFCIFRGTKSTGKVIYITTIFPYLMLIILMVRGCTLEGAAKGIAYYLKPNLAQLLKTEVWVQAGSQVCYSYAICFTVLVAYGSFSEFNSDCYKRTIYLSISCSFTSFIGGFVVFAVLGNMSEVLQLDIDRIVEHGPGLAFITYPTALSLMPIPQLWNCFFFFMLITLAIDSQFCCLEGLLTLFYDSIPITRRYREIFSGLFCTCLFLIGLVFVTPGGLMVFELFNNYAVSGIALLWLVTWQSIGIGWVYGADRYFEAIKQMIGYYPSFYMGLCFRFITPVLTAGVMLSHMITYNPTEAPLWHIILGWFLTLSSFLCPPIWALYEVLRRNGSFTERIRNAMRPPDANKMKLNYISVQHPDMIAAQEFKF